MTNVASAVLPTRRSRLASRVLLLAPAVLFAVIFAVEIAIILYAAPALDPLAPIYVT
jgi:hypothetical protein